MISTIIKFRVYLLKGNSIRYLYLYYIFKEYLFLIYNKVK